MTPQIKHEALLVRQDDSSAELGFHIVPIQQLQDAIDYIIHYNPMIVIVDQSMTGTSLSKIRQSVRPWFSGKIIHKSEFKLWNKNTFF
jgi:hypothetical protein